MSCLVTVEVLGSSYSFHKGLSQKKSTHDLIGCIDDDELLELWNSQPEVLDGLFDNGHCKEHSIRDAYVPILAKPF